jgi:hypothetical protein
MLRRNVLPPASVVQVQELAPLYRQVVPQGGVREGAQSEPMEKRSCKGKTWLSAAGERWNSERGRSLSRTRLQE